MFKSNKGFFQTEERKVIIVNDVYGLLIRSIS